MRISKIETETISSRKKVRKVYNLLDDIQEGDVLIVTELSRLARSVTEVSKIVSDVLFKGAVLYVVEGVNGIHELRKDDAVGNLMVSVLGISAQMERDLISERTKSALRARKAQGVKLGRPEGQSKLDERKDEILECLNKYKMSKAKTAQYLGVARGTLLNWLDKERITA